MSTALSSSETSVSPLPPIVERQQRYTWRRRILRDWLLRPLGFRLIIKATITGVEHIPAEGPTLLVMNHIAFPDPAVVTGAVRSRFVVPMSKIENFKNPFIGTVARVWGAYPIDREHLDRQALETTIALLSAGHCVLIAPEGTRQPALIKAKEGFTYVAVKANAAVVPVGLEGTHLLGRNLKRLRRTRVEVRFGPAFRFTTRGRTRIPRPELHRMTHEAMCQLALLVDEQRRGYYADLSQVTTGTLEFVE
jgi:1-acyl-sn-glycerol-3-phosphate acyltransferase